MLILLLGLFSCLEKSNNPLDIDDDGDGFSEFEGDCDDMNPNAYPGTAELDSTELCMVDNDDDGYGDDSVWGFSDNKGYRGTDCDDTTYYTNPGMYDLNVDGTDQDCDGVDGPNGNTGTDNDGDGQGDDSVEDFSGNEGHRGTDCDDNDPSTVNDMDCAGVLSVDDCDDGNASTINDMDCDGVITAYDCDDSNSNLAIACTDSIISLDFVIEFPVGQYCSEGYSGSGFLLSDPAEIYDYQTICPSCAYFFSMANSTSHICNHTVTLGSTTILGIDVSNSPQITLWINTPTEEQISSVFENGQFDINHEAEFIYGGTIYPYSIDGTITVQ